MGTQIEVGIVKPTGDTTGSKAQNAEWFTADLSPIVLGVSLFRITFAVNSDCVVEVTVDSGDNWLKLKDGFNIKANALNVMNVPIRQNDQFNMRTSTVSGTTVLLCRIDEGGQEN